MEQVVSTSENYLVCGEIKDAFWQLKQKMCNFISPVEGAGWETVVRRGICCCKLTGALQNVTKSTSSVYPWCSVIWSTGICDDNDADDVMQSTIMNFKNPVSKNFKRNVKCTDNMGNKMIIYEYNVSNGNNTILCIWN